MSLPPPLPPARRVSPTPAPASRPADDAGGEPVREDGHRGDRNEREEGGLGEDAVHRLEKEGASELEKGQSQQRDIEDQVEDTGDVKAGRAVPAGTGAGCG